MNEASKTPASYDSARTLPPDWTCDRCGKTSAESTVFWPKSRMDLDERVTLSEYGMDEGQFFAGKSVALCEKCNGSHWSAPVGQRAVHRVKACRACNDDGCNLCMDDIFEAHKRHYSGTRAANDPKIAVPCTGVVGDDEDLRSQARRAFREWWDGLTGQQSIDAVMVDCFTAGAEWADRRAKERSSPTDRHQRHAETTINEGEK